ncbi:MAG: hypothetical protein J6Q22_11015 [Prevotella sp.]|nr:hypothetical protein [Prevotella sp.]
MERFEDITAEMRAFKNHPNAKKSVSGSFLTGLLYGLANRLDAARKRECEPVGIADSLGIKNIINNELKPDVWGVRNNAYSGEYVHTLPDLERAAAQSPYGGVTGRPRELKGWIRLPDGRRFYLGKIAVKFDGWGDGLLTEVDMRIRADKCEETDDEV